ncbi:MAG: type IX secretion system sortase PorU [candidate division KSB1 bacterium]|nr:type IX secretion system sortase PorU [candidate division KSB1 bacterium]
MQSAPDFLELQLRQITWHGRPIEIDGRPYLQMDMPEATDVIIRDGIEVPVLVFPVAIPENTDRLDIQISQQAWQSLPGDRPLKPALIYLKDGDLYRTALAPDTLNARPWPQVAEVIDIGWWRDVKIARVRVALLKKQGGRYFWLQSLRLRLQWPAPVRPPAATVPAGAEKLRLYRQALLNADQLPRFMRVRPPTPLRKPRGHIQTGKSYLKMAVEQTGIYRVTGDLLQKNGVTLADIDPAQLRMYNNGGRPLPEPLSAARPDSLIEIPILVADGGDGKFDAGDAIYFFGVAPQDWAFQTGDHSWKHYTNPYSNENVYWLSWTPQSGPPKRLSELAAPIDAANAVSRGLRLQKIENDFANLIRSGLNWFGRELAIGGQTTASYKFTLANPPAGDSGYVRIRCAAETPGQHFVQISLNGQVVGTLSWFGSSTYEGYVYISKAARRFPFRQLARAGENEILLQYASTSAYGSIRVDWIELVAGDALIADKNTLTFAVEPAAGITTFSMTGFNNTPLVMDVTRPLAPRLLATQRQGDAVLFADTLDIVTGKRYFAAAEFLEPTRFEPYTFSDIRNPANKADLIIITHQDFWQQGERLAEHKRNFRGMDVMLVDISTIMNEFAWGLLDPVAIRDFLAYAYNNWAKKPSYVLLLGDGDYDYRNLSDRSDKNWIPPYQTTDSDELANRNIEAFFTYVSGSDRIMDLAIGRLPVRTAEEAENAVDKIIRYESEPEFGFWRTLITMVADDELVRGGVGDETFHVLDAERIVENYVPDYLNVRKIYLMEYRGVRSASISGVRKPGANRDLIDQINQGTLIVNYVGHGNPQQWAHEVVFEQSQDYDRIDNGYRLPFIIAATCDFGRFDMVNRQSFAEDLLNMAGRGVIGLMTASRAVFANKNAQFNRQYYQQLFKSDLTSIPVGDAFVLTRLYTNNLVNDEKYSIFGDPTIRLLNADRWARVSAVVPDSLIALQKTTVSGETRDRNNGLLVDNGDLEIVVFDAPRDRVYVTERGSVARATACRATCCSAAPAPSKPDGSRSISSCRKTSPTAATMHGSAYMAMVSNGRPLAICHRCPSACAPAWCMMTSGRSSRCISRTGKTSSAAIRCRRAHDSSPPSPIPFPASTSLARSATRSF